jgi:hypothetical protein
VPFFPNKNIQHRVLFVIELEPTQIGYLTFLRPRDTMYDYAESNTLTYFQPSLIFAVEQGACVSLWVTAYADNFRLMYFTLKSCVTNALAYFWILRLPRV